MESGELDKSKYQTKTSIGDGVRNGVKDYFDSVKKGKGTSNVVVKRVYKARVVKNKEEVK